MIVGQDIDGWVEFVLAGLLAEEGTVDSVSRALVAEMAARHPHAPALLAVLPLSMAAAAIEAMLAEPRVRGQAEITWRVAALMASEVLALQIEAESGLPPDLAALNGRLGADPAALGGAGAASA